MVKKVLQILKENLLFWKSFLFQKNKREFIKTNSGAIKKQLVVVLLAFSCIYITYNSLKPAVKGACRVILQSDDGLLSALDARITGVEAKKVKIGTTLRQVKSIGTLKAHSEVLIKAEIPGKIKDILFTEGAQVKKDDDLIIFEDELYKAEKEKCEAEYTLTKGEFERNKKLYESKVGAQKTYEEALAKMNAAKAQLDGAIFNLTKTRIRAPFDGTVGIMKVPLGNIVQQHTELVAIVDNSIIEVEFWVPAKFIEDVAVGQTVDITVDAFKDRVFSGTVDAIDSEVDVKSHSILVRARIENKSGALRHGMFSNVILVTGEKTNVVLIDEDALDREGSVEFVWAIDEKHRAYRKRVLTGAKDVNGVEVLAGLKEGEVVVVAGQLKLSDGAKTEILNKQDFEEDKGKSSEKKEEDSETKSKDHKTESDKSSDSDDKNTEKETAEKHGETDAKSDIAEDAASEKSDQEQYKESEDNKEDESSAGSEQ